MYYVSHLANDLHCDQEELQEFIRSTGIYYKSDFGVMKIKKEDVDNIIKYWTESENTDEEKLILKGRNGVVKVEDGIIEIIRQGLMGWVATGNVGRSGKRIFIKNIASIELGEDPSKVYRGVSYIKFVTTGDSAERRTYYKGEIFSTRAGELAQDPNTVQISNEKQYKIAIKIRDYIENYQANQINQEDVKTTLSGADEILKYKKLLDDGILTQEEFDAKKKQILGI